MSTVDKLRDLHMRYRKRYRGNKNSEQMCCMWSISRPPDDIYNTDQVYSIEEAFNIAVSEDDALELYDMDVVEAAAKIDMIIAEQS